MPLLNILCLENRSTRLHIMKRNLFLYRSVLREADYVGEITVHFLVFLEFFLTKIEFPVIQLLLNHQDSFYTIYLQPSLFTYHVASCQASVFFFHLSRTIRRSRWRCHQTIFFFTSTYFHDQVLSLIEFHYSKNLVVLISLCKCCV